MKMGSNLTKWLDVARILFRSGAPEVAGFCSLWRACERGGFNAAEVLHIYSLS